MSGVGRVEPPVDVPILLRVVEQALGARILRVIVGEPLLLELPPHGGLVHQIGVVAGRLSRLRSVDILVAVPDLRQLVVDRLFLDLSRLRQILGVPLSQILVVLDGVVLGLHQELLALFITHASEHLQLLAAE